MGYEEDIVGTAARMIFKREFPSEIPKGPRPRQAGEEDRDPPIWGGSANHEALARMTRLLYAYEADPPRIAAELAGCIKFLDYNLATGFMCRANACEQTPPSHFQQWLSAVIGMLYIGVTYGMPTFAKRCQHWLSGNFALCELGWVPSLKKVILPGARHFTDKIARMPMGGSNYQNNRLYAWYRGAQSLPNNAVNGDPLQNIDDFSLILCARFPAVADAILKLPADQIPPLRWPMTMYRNGEDFVGWLPSVTEKGVQRIAGWVDGQEVYGFDGAQDPADSFGGGGWSKSIITGSPIRVGESPAPIPVDPTPEPPKPEPTDSAKQIAAEMKALAARLERLS